METSSIGTEATEQEPSGEAIIDLPADKETGLRVGRITIFGPVGSGKTEIGCALAKMMTPPSFEEKYILSPVATAANRLPDFKWFKIDPTDKKKVEAFMASMNEKRAFLLIDEADAYFGGSGRTYGTPSMFGAVNWGRNFCLSMVVIAHGTSVAPKNLIENSQGVLFFRTTTPGLLEYAESYMPEVPDATYTLRNLPDHVALVYAPLGKEKFVGFAKLDLATGEIQIWRPNIEDLEENESTTEEGSSESPSPEPAGSTGSTTPSSSGARPGDGKSTASPTSSRATSLPSGSGANG